tara:strand:+ start:229 stop:762 length:534 start_codon:yes stop_codon:yes gene_type:complete
MRLITLLILAYCLNPVFIQSSPRPITVAPQKRDLTPIIVHSDQLPFIVTISSTWIKLTPNSMQLDRYFLYRNTLTAEFSISQLETTQIDILANVNRWRNQLKLAALVNYTPKPIITPLGKAYDIIISDHPTTAIKVRIFPFKTHHYFFKFHGDKDLVKLAKYPTLSPEKSMIPEKKQ